MDPVSIIVAAVVAGATSGVTDAVKDQVQDAYTALRSRILERFRDSRLIKRSLADIEREPTTENEDFLTESLADKGINDDDELVDLANEVIARTGLSVKLSFKIAKGARVTESGASIEGLNQDSPADIYHSHTVEESAVVDKSPSRIIFRDSNGR